MEAVGGLNRLGCLVLLQESGSGQRLFEVSGSLKEANITSREKL